jgi:hypothetical protein
MFHMTTSARSTLVILGLVMVLQRITSAPNFSVSNALRALIYPLDMSLILSAM